MIWYVRTLLNKVPWHLLWREPIAEYSFYPFKKAMYTMYSQPGHRFYSSLELEINNIVLAQVVVVGPVSLLRVGGSCADKNMVETL
jgi:hypothetical protein